MRFLSLIRQALEGLTEIVGRSAALPVIPLALATVYEVLARYLFGAPTLWSLELGYILMGVHFLFAGSYALKRNHHVRIDLLNARYPALSRAALDLALLLPAVLLIIDRIGAFAWRAFETGERSGQSARNPPIRPFRFLVVAAFCLLLLQIVANCTRCIEALAGRRDYPER
jgi:TRAP-type mannitol/chloroaromatic compound transport system permease small subunit